MDQVLLRGAISHLRFAPSPLAELALSTMIVRYPDRHPFHERWFAETAEARRKVGEDRITALINPEKCVIDILLRHPVRRGGSFRQELSAIAEVDAGVFRRDVERVWGAPPREMGTTDAAVKSFILEVVDEYWHACFERYWPSFKAVLDADVMFRGSVMASNGVTVAVAGATPPFIVHGNDLVLPLHRGSANGFSRDVDARGVTLLPTLVKWGMNFPNSVESDLVFSYRARGRGRLQPMNPDTRPGLIGILGRTRADLLVSLDEPASSTAIAIFLGVTTTAVNQHLRALSRAGLLQSSRFGRYVLYERSELGSALVGVES